MPRLKHECFTQYCAFCQQNREAGHCSYKLPLKNELPRSDKVLFAFYDFKTTKDTQLTESTTVRIPNLVCIKHFCSLCEKEPNIDVNCVRCSRRRHAFYDDLVGDLLTYLCKQRPWCEKVIAIAHNAKGFDAHFILDRAILLKWIPKLTLNGEKIACLKIQHLTFLDSIPFVPMALRKLPKAFGLTAFKSWYSHYFHTRSNLDNIGSILALKIMASIR